MITSTKRAESPAGNGMTIVQALPTDFTGAPLDTTVPSVLSVVPTVNGQYGPTTATPGKLSRAGVIAMLGALNTYLSGLTAAQQDAINGQMGGGIHVSVTPQLVICPVAAGGAGTLATSIASVLTTGGNVVSL